MEDNENTSTLCAHCQRKLDLGVDVIRLEPGVIGPRGFVSLGEPKFFCDEDCLEHFASDEEVVRVPRRVP